MKEVESSRVRCLRRRIADMARHSGREDEESMRERFKARASGWDWRRRERRTSAWDRWSLEDDMRLDIRVSKWAGFGPRRRASSC